MTIRTATKADDSASSTATVSSAACRRPTMSSIDQGHKLKNKAYEMSDADRFYSEERYHECVQKCYEILRAEPSEAIRGKAHMYLATEAVGPEQAAGRAYHAEMAISCWHTVLDRTGTSRYPSAKAKLQLEIAERLAKQADALAKEEDNRYIDNDAKSTIDERKSD